MAASRALGAAAWETVAAAGHAACAEADLEAALWHLTGAALAATGDPDAPARPGGLKPGERPIFVSGVYLVAPGAGHQILVAEHGFPAGQHHMALPIDSGYPGRVFRRRQACILPNTDDHADFTQILKTARMGSSMYAPMLCQGEMVGQVIAAAQARHTYADVDLAVMGVLAGLAAALYAAMDGASLVADLHRQLGL